MIWLLTRPVVWPLRSTRFGVSAGFRLGRLLGYRRLSYLAVGVAVGLLVAPVPGRELRRRLRERLVPEPPLAEVVDLRLPAAAIA
jgi:hypothetical protein